ncbi:uncharacterized protein LOC123607958 isoform X2 [Leopardus geoffroyi]|uniref:uncharacterized protein LOC123607958 isoform X2 n=1 Tax=Leopardus geoffroyi TaxID=46844 RepID=UPI001E264BB6|nr:uncharacterized protein LOC123607958 isoform X2 [Leopardus geoffroyi]
MFRERQVRLIGGEDTQLTGQLVPPGECSMTGTGFSSLDSRVSLTNDYHVASIFPVFEWEFLLRFSCSWCTVVCWGDEGEKVYLICSQVSKPSGRVPDECPLHLDLGGWPYFSQESWAPRKCKKPELSGLLQPQAWSWDHIASIFFVFRCKFQAQLRFKEQALHRGVNTRECGFSWHATVRDYKVRSSVPTGGSSKSKNEACRTLMWLVQNVEMSRKEDGCVVTDASLPRTD